MKNLDNDFAALGLGIGHKLPHLFSVAELAQGLCHLLTGLAAGCSAWATESQDETGPDLNFHAPSFLNSFRHLTP
jgi:hypothetical protein